MALNVGAMLLAFIALIAMANALLGWGGGFVGLEDLSFQRLLGWILAPLAWFMGVPWVDAVTVGSLAVERLIEAFQEELISIEELRARIPELRRRTNGASAQLEALESQLIDRDTYLRLAENLETFLSTLHERAQTLSVEERQKVLRLVVKEVHVDHDRVVIKHSIPPSDGDPGSGYLLRSWGDDAALGRALVRREEGVLVHEPGLQPLPKDLPVHRDVLQKPFMADVVKTAANISLQDPFHRVRPDPEASAVERPGRNP